MTNISSFIESFIAAVDFQEPQNIKFDTPLKSLEEWDSLAALGVIVMFDVEFSKNITGDDLKKCETVEDLFNLLNN